MTNVTWKSCPVCGDKILNSYKMCFGCLNKIKKVTLDDLDNDVRSMSDKVDEIIDTLNEVITKVNELEKLVNERNDISGCEAKDSKHNAVIRKKPKENASNNGDA